MAHEDLPAAKGIPGSSWIKRTADRNLLDDRHTAPLARIDVAPVERFEELISWRKSLFQERRPKGPQAGFYRKTNLQAGFDGIPAGRWILVHCVPVLFAANRSVMNPSVVQGQLEFVRIVHAADHGRTVPRQRDFDNVL